MMKNIRIVLVQPSHPGNIGSVARAMKTMGLSELYLVSPKSFPHPESKALATHAEDILDNAVVVNGLLESIKDVQMVYATSANTRDVDLPIYSAREAAATMIKESSNTKIAILFGPERIGLTNKDLLYAYQLIQIPTSDDYHSLNLAQAVQIIVYELMMASKEIKKTRKQNTKMASVEHLEYFYHQLEKISVQMKVLNPQNPRQFMQHMRRLFNRAKLSELEVNLLISILNEKNR